MLHMAKRPFAAVTVLLNGSVTSTAVARRRRAPDLRPIAIEPTGDGRAAVTSVLVRSAIYLCPFPKSINEVYIVTWSTAWIHW